MKKLSIILWVLLLATPVMATDGGEGLVSPRTARVNLATDVPLPAGDNAIGTVIITESPDVTIDPTSELPAGNNAIGTVIVTELPDVSLDPTSELPAGNNAIGTVIVTELLAGSNVLGKFMLVDPDDNTREMKFDAKFQVPVTINVDHHKIHEGDSFLVDHVMAVAAGFSLCFQVPSGTKRCHMIVSWVAESKAEVQLWEGREWDASSGSLKTVYNRDRNSVNPSQVQENQSTGAFIANSAVILNPDNIGIGANAAGTQIHHWETWSDKKTTDRARGINEWILKNDETYVITFTSNDGNKDGQLILDWYEHTDE